MTGAVSVLFVKVSIVALPTRVSVAFGRVSVFELPVEGTASVTVPVLDPFNIKCLPAANAMCSEDVQAPEDEYHSNVLLVEPYNKIPPPLAVESVGVATLPISIFLSVTCSVDDSI